MGEVYLLTGVWFIMNPKSTGSNNGFTGRNEHGDPHVEVNFQGNKADLFIKTGKLKIKVGKIHRRMKDASEILLNNHKNELLKMWETGDIYLIANKHDHK